MAEKKYFKLSERTLKNGTVKKIITIDDSIKPTKQELEEKQAYVNAGYVIAHKSQKRAEAARKRAKETGFGKKKKTEETETTAE